MALTSLTIEDMSDREFLHVLLDVAEADGWASSDDVSKQIGMPKRFHASSRLSWLQRFGAVEREHERDVHGNIRYRKDGKPRYTQRWRLTEIGEAVAFGTLGKRQQDQLAKIDDDQMMHVMHWLTDRVRQANPTTIKLVAREWRYGSSGQRNGRVS
jgi:hypothetical protein